MIEELADWGGGGGEVVAPNEKILIVTGSFHTTESSIVATCLLHIWEGQSLSLNSTCSVDKGSHLPLLISHREFVLVNRK